MTVPAPLGHLIRANLPDLLHGTPRDSQDAFDHITAAIHDPRDFGAVAGYLAQISARELQRVRNHITTATSPFFLAPSSERSPRRSAQQIITALANDDIDMSVALIRPYAIQNPHTPAECAELLGALAEGAIYIHGRRCVCCAGGDL